ncbi:MAG: PHP domain protein [Candidatus Wolfebacteria bacterium GW2011_GWC2_46_275]|nr:MAG: PHP domain protein [Candidatus Wolfebacteria bacterium GW2011_GWC2_46_275]KKU42591.1 MAG: PHP domain protein [Candidatus Wolfebacteria bacterium GW2011_GWB2_46_69]KKU54674.1 MAG: PHP domain protein [Candidatus Wolfebacteria bacterium GW2011_GWC1_47_103]KKU59154.1 MAG: PHP domain protein [Candidatus Wolfebacteria bacterium GW2011_GWE2_47_12]KKU66466.1 MAG: PHP domain protein [Candidatus Wolfebacteria bacterium GW2011_GWD2_47_17]KKU73014.1 MAG: PHP domain protein [Candidatus Wolfebacteri
MVYGQRWYTYDMRITNAEIAQLLSEIAEYLEMDDVPFKPRAYQKVADVIESLDEEIVEIYKKGGLKAIGAIPGVGISIAKTIEEYVTTGRVAYHEELKKKIPVDLRSLTAVEGLGPKKIKKLYKQIGIKNLQDLEVAATSGKLAEVEGFGVKSAENILKGIEFLKTSGGRLILGDTFPAIAHIKEELEKIKGVERVDIVGSARRKRETVGDFDLLVIAKDSQPVMDFFVQMDEVVHVYAQGETKSSVRIRSGVDVDIRVVSKESYGAALLYFTGSKAHNVTLRQLAIKKGLKLNEYGLYRMKGNKEEKMVAGDTEEGIYNMLGMTYIEPEMREDMGEVDLAQNHRLPTLIEYDAIRGDLQIQTNWSDGSNTIEEYVDAAMQMGLEYIVITDHTKRLTVANGLDEQRLLEQMKAIDAVNAKLKKEGKRFAVLKGSEVDILKDGSLDIADEVLRQLDVVGASVHSYFNLSRELQTKRIIAAMENPNVDIIFHPTGRVINRRPAYDVDMDAIIDAAKRTKTILEINAFPDRLDLKEEYVRKCVQKGVLLSIDTDAHSINHLQFLVWGIGQARRGWAEQSNIVNAWPVEKMKKMLK